MKGSDVEEKGAYENLVNFCAFLIYMQRKLEVNGYTLLGHALLQFFVF